MNITNEQLDCMIEKYVAGFQKLIYEQDPDFQKRMKENMLADDDPSKYDYWEWPQGVGLYGIWKLFCQTGNEYYKDILTTYYDRQLKVGLPSKNVNTTAPLLTLSFLGEYLKEEKYLIVCREWAEWIYRDFPRTQEGGLQHITSDCVNKEELWDDTLFMTVLFLANMGRILEDECYLKEAEHQFLLHAKYLTDEHTGLWFHGWTFLGRHNFAGALWGRGNSWITAGIPEYLSIAPCTDETRKTLIECWRRQVEALVRCQDAEGMWHTLLDDMDSYQEASATCGIAYGILKGVHLGIGKEKWAEVAVKALAPIMNFTDDEGIVGQVSYGTPMGRESKDFYKQIEIRPTAYGQALAMLFFMESKINNNHV